MKKYDLIVIGGGLSGVSAAISASRLGLSVLIIEQSGNLGGAMSNCLVYPFMPYWTTGSDGKKKFLSSGIFTEMRERQKKYTDTFDNMNFSPENFKFVLDEMVEENKIDVLFHSTVYDVAKDGRNINSVMIATKSGSMKAEANIFIDASGDGDLFYLAGCDYRLGRESDRLCQPMTTCFRVANVNEKLFTREESDRIQKMYKEYRADGRITNPREDILYFKGLGKGIVHFNTTRVIKLNPTEPSDISKAEILARKQINELMQFLRQNSPAFKEAFIINIAPSIGVRESRMLNGEYVLNSDDLIKCKKFDDSIALGNYDIDIHNPEGSGTSHYYFKSGEYYTIPYRSLIPKEFDNLLVAGRCISASHEAQASIRIMPICATTGEATGTAAGIMASTKTNTHTVDINLIRKTLKDNAAAIE